jgi:beta-lactamase regulating signal transducer with metallopeptidase domain
MTNSEMKNMSPAIQNDSNFKTNISDMTRYMRFIGIVTIIGGAIYCLGIITAIIGVPIIIMGIRIREAAESFKRYSLTSEFSDLSHAVERQTRLFS